MWIQKVRGSVAALAYAPDGQTLYSADNSGGVRAWDLASRTSRQALYLGPVRLLRADGLRPLTDGRHLLLKPLVGVFVHDLETGQTLLRTEPPGFLTHRASLLRDDGQLLEVSPDDRSIRTWDVLSKETGPVFGPWPQVTDLLHFDVTPDGNTLAVSKRNGRCSVIDLPSGELRGQFHPNFDADLAFFVRFSPDGKTLAAYSMNRMQLWDVPSRAVRVPQITSALPGFALAFHPTDPAFASLNEEQVLTLYSSETGEPIRSLDFALGKKVTCVTFAPDGLTCAVGGSGKQFVVFDVDV